MEKKWSFIFVLAASVFLVGCANQSMPGYQKVYQGYDIPQSLVDTVQRRMVAEGLKQAVVTRDTVGRLRLAGQYKDEDEVDKAFIISQSLVGIKSTSPFYPDNVVEKRWQKDAENSLADYFKQKKQAKLTGPGKKYALVIGINKFIDPILTEIQGEDDARIMGLVLANYGFEVSSMLGERATKKNIENAVAEMERKLGSNDSLFIYVSSHGNPPIPTPSNGDERKMSIAAYDSGDINPQSRSKDNTSYQLNFQKTSIKDTLIQKLAQRPTAATRVIIDTCYSGEILKDLPSEGATYQAQQHPQQQHPGTHPGCSVHAHRQDEEGINFHVKARAQVRRRACCAGKPAVGGVQKNREGCERHQQANRHGTGEGVCDQGRGAPSKDGAKRGDPVARAKAPAPSEKAGRKKHAHRDGVREPHAPARRAESNKQRQRSQQRELGKQSGHGAAVSRSHGASSVMDATVLG